MPLHFEHETQQPDANARARLNIWLRWAATAPEKIVQQCMYEVTQWWCHGDPQESAQAKEVEFLTRLRATVGSDALLHVDLAAYAEPKDVLDDLAFWRFFCAQPGFHQIVWPCRCTNRPAGSSAEVPTPQYPSFAPGDSVVLACPKCFVSVESATPLGGDLSVES
jgi:hypothetical protein